MNLIERARRLAAAAPTLLILMLLIPALPPAAAAQRPPSVKGVRFVPGGLLGRADGYALSYGIENTSREALWAVAEFDGPGDERLCDVLKRIEPSATLVFECPLASVAPGERYPLRLSVYSDARFASRVVRFEPVFRTSADDLAALDVVRAGLTAPDPTPGPMTDDAAATPELPATFHPTWYRRARRGLSVRAYDASGRLTIRADTLLFDDGDRTIRIPAARITSVRLDGMSKDLSNEWVVVRYEDDAQEAAAIGFRDGGALGMGKDTGTIYLAVRRAWRR